MGEAGGRGVGSLSAVARLGLGTSPAPLHELQHPTRWLCQRCPLSLSAMGALHRAWVVGTWGCRAAWDTHWDTSCLPRSR